MNQETVLMRLMKKRWVTPLVALEAAGCLRLGARVFDMKENGTRFEEKWVETKSGKRVKAFRLAKERK